jgi:hypothetical protein
MRSMNGQEVALEMRRLRPQAPIILLADGRGVPGPALNLVDAVVFKDRLASQVLPTITYLHGCGRIPPPLYEA